MESGKTPVIQQLSYLMEHYNTASFSLGKKPSYLFTSYGIQSTFTSRGDKFVSNCL